MSGIELISWLVKRTKTPPTDAALLATLREVLPEELRAAVIGEPWKRDARWDPPKRSATKET